MTLRILPMSVLLLTALGGTDTCSGGSCTWQSELAAAEEHLGANPPKLMLALPLLVNVMKRKPKHKDTRINLANLYSELGMPTKAAKHIRKLIKITTHRGSDTERSEAHYMLAKHYLRHKEPQNDTIQALRLALNADSTNNNAKHWLAHQLSRSPNGEREAASLLSSIQLDKLTDNHPLDSLMLLGQAKERLGDLDGSIGAFRQASHMYRQENPETMQDKVRFRYGLSHFQLARLLLLTDSANEAVEVARWSQKAFPPVYQLTDVLSVALAQTGQMEEALENYRIHRDRMREWPAEWRTMPERVWGASLAWILEKHKSTLASNQLEYNISRGDRGDTGGWSDWSPGKDSPLASLVSSKCNIDQRSAANFTAAAFLRDYASKNKPVIIRKCAISGKSLIDEWPALQSWRKDEFLARFGKRTVQARQSSVVAFDNEFGACGH
jgi:tetratricopeptide (TPR) repeat protein